MDELAARGHIPLDKSWVIRMGILDMLHGRRDIEEFLAAQENLGDDLLALGRSAKAWREGGPIDVGEAGTLYRLLRFAAWKLGLEKEFVRRGTLAQRTVTDDSSIVTKSQPELLALDNGTSQWASAAALLGDPERLPNPPYKLGITYEAIDHWNAARAKGEPWQPRYDQTILKQARAFLSILETGKADYAPEQPEDFCFARTFGFVDDAEGERRWPSLRGHESDRIAEMSATLASIERDEIVTSRDHRVVQAAAMWGLANKREVKVEHPDAVAKSWPQFWDFLKRAEGGQ